MAIKRNLLVAAFGLAALAAAGTASAETRWDHNHPRQHEVLARDNHLRHEVRVERRDGAISDAKAHRLLVKDREIRREDHAIAHANGGYVTRGEQHAINHQENRLARRAS